MRKLIYTFLLLILSYSCTNQKANELKIKIEKTSDELDDISFQMKANEKMQDIEISFLELESEAIHNQEDSPEKAQNFRDLAAKYIKLADVIKADVKLLNIKEAELDSLKKLLKNL